MINISGKWKDSNRVNQLPKNWKLIRIAVMRRDNYTCQEGNCRNLATDVDHIKPGNDHSMSNLRAICSEHHRKKSSSEGYAAMNKKRKDIDQRFRRTETHPSLL